MTEIEDLVGIYGAIDAAVAADDSLVEVVSPFLCPYKEGGAVGWFKQFTEWTAERTGVHPSEQYPPLEAALRHLADIAPRGRMQARRLLALTVAARVFPEMAELVVEALAVDGLAGDMGKASLLLDLMLDDEFFQNIDMWEGFIEEAFNREELVPQSTRMQSTAPPCSTHVVMVNVLGDPDPVATLRTHFCTDKLTLEQAKGFLDPTQWPNCNGLWCSMTKTGVNPNTGNPVYKEVVSVNCKAKGKVWTAEACLEFTMVNITNGVIVSYDLCDGHPQPGDAVLVDSGSLVVLQRGNKVCVWTTKRVKFDHPFDGPSLAALTCALGYGAVAEDLVFNCALADPNNPGAGGTPFPGTDPPEIPVLIPGEDDVAKATPTETGTKDCCDPPTVTAVIGDAVDATKQCIEDCAEAYQTSYTKVTEGCYSTSDLVKDTTKMWARMVRDVAMAADLSMKMTKAVAATAPTATASAAATTDRAAAS